MGLLMCARGPPCQNAFQVDAVFAGTVRSISALPEDGPPLRPDEARIPRAVRVEFSSVVAFRGIQASTVSVLYGGQRCCVWLHVQGGRTLPGVCKPGGRWHGARSRHLLPNAAARRRRRRSSFSADAFDTERTRARVYGTITHWERDLATGEPRDHGPVPGVLVTVRGPGSAFDASTDARGRYEVTVPPGKYEITAMPPAGFSTRYLKQTTELRDARACFVADFGVQFDGRIRGVVRQSSGEPAEGVSVEVMAVEAVGKTGYIQTLQAVKR